MNRFIQRLLSLFLSTILVLSSMPISIHAEWVAPGVWVGAGGSTGGGSTGGGASGGSGSSSHHTMSKNNMVLGTQDYMDLSEFDKGAADRPKPDFQMLRFSLITTGENSDASRGNIYTGSEVPNNPVSIANPKGGLESYNENAMFEYDRVRQLVNTKRYDDHKKSGAADTKRGTGHVLNTRRDYTGNETGVIFYNADSTKVYDDPANPSTSSYHEEISGFDAYFVPICYDEAMPQVIDGGTARSTFQDSPPSGFSQWSSMDAGDFFYEYTQASFIPEDVPSGVSISGPVPDCIYRVLAYMIGLDSPYSSQAIAVQ